MTDVFSKWVEAFAIRNTVATTLARVLVDEVICRYGVLKSIHSDQGANLCGEVVQGICNLIEQERQLIIQWEMARWSDLIGQSRQC